MKNNIVIVAVILMSVVAGTVFAEDQIKNQDKFVVKFGVDTNGLQDYPSTSTGTITNLGTGSNTVDLGYSLLMEYQHPLGEVFSIGAGATYNFDRGIGVNGGKFSFLPVYVTASLYPLGSTSGFSPYAKGDLGYNISYTGNDQYKWNSPFQTTLTGGMYWGIGAGVKISNMLFVDIMYTAYAGTYHVALGPLSADADILYTKVSLNAGVGFDI